MTKTYDVIAKCKTPECDGMLRFGATTADSLSSLAAQLRHFKTQEKTCPVCQRTLTYTYQDYVATPLDEKPFHPTNE